MTSLSEYLNIFVTLLAIVDPLGAIPIYIGLRPTQSDAAHRRTVWLTTLSVAVILVASALFGERLIRLFGISLSSFRIAGGLLLLLVGISMLHPQAHERGRAEGSNRLAGQENVAVVPLAMPLLSGPGAISSMIIYAHRSNAWEHQVGLVVISLAIALATGAILWMARPIGRALGKTGINIGVRLMGLLLAAAGVEFITSGLSQLFPILTQLTSH